MTKPSSYTWLLFDADGTLFDYHRAESQALSGAFRAFGLPFDERIAALYQEINRQVWVDFEAGRISAEALRVARFERLFQATGAVTDPAEFSRRYLLNLGQSSDLLDGALDLIETLRPRFQLGLITNGLKDVQRARLAGSPLADVFDVLAISEELGVAKPDARFFELVLKQAEQPNRENVLVIGDSLSSDILGGLNAGIDTCWFNPAGLPPDPRIPATYTIRRLADLLSLVDGAAQDASRITPV